VGARQIAARRAVMVAGALSRSLGAGGGSTVGGRIGLALDPGLLGSLARGRTVALVSGTNGKTTTTRMLAEALGGTRGVATSSAGANMPAGLVSALVSAPAGQPGVLEVDEGYLRDVARSVSPRVIVALNLSRDQLDRVSEVRMIAARWRDAFAESAATVVANCDDPLVTWAAREASAVVWVAAGGLWQADAHHCPACDAEVRFAGPGEAPGWRCGCGLERPLPDAVLDGEILVTDGRSARVDLAIPGRFNLANAAMAAVAATVLGRDLGGALGAIGRVDEVAGRFAVVKDGPVAVRLLLAKNPAGWSELIAMIAASRRPVVVAINARDADGHDPSWLWDVPFERLAGATVVATGERRDDLAVRLKHAGVAHVVVDDQVAALHVAAPEGDVDYVGNYTAFQQLRRALREGARERRTPDTSELCDPRAPLALAHVSTPPGPAVVPRPHEPCGDHGDRDGRAEPLVSPGHPLERGRSRARASSLTVVVVHPDLLGTYGDGGNGAVLADRAAWRGLTVELLLATSDRPLPRSGDLYCLGGGEDGPQGRSAERLADGVLAGAVARGATVLAVCAGFQIVGTTFAGPGGAVQPGIGLVDADTVRGTGKRAVGEAVVETVEHAAGGFALDAGELLSGFENHAGVTRLGASVAPLGRVRSGVGNGTAGLARSEGAVSGRVVCTYLHGPVLARNPQLADRLLECATGIALAPLDDDEEALLRRARLETAPARLRPGIRRRVRVR